MNKFKTIIRSTFITLAFLMLCLLPNIESKATELTSNEEDFVIKNGVLTKYVGEGGDVLVPDGVIDIGICAFQWNDDITSVTLPNTVISIDGWAFSGCDNLKSVKMCDTVTSIGYMAFWDCKNLMEISSLNSVMSIGSGAFGLTPWLGERSKENPIVVVNGLLIDGRTCEGKVVIPDVVTCIVESAFTFNQKVTSVTIPNSVKSIGNGAFSDCRYLDTVKMSDSVQQIGTEAFRNCIRLKNVRLSNSLKVIEGWSFDNCKSLIKITIPYSVGKIEGIAFRECKKLKYVTISNKVTSVEQYGVSAFEDCPNLTFYGLEKSYIQSYAKKRKIPFKTLSLAVTKKTITVGDTYSLNMNSQAICTWKSSNKSIATVDSYGKIKAKKKGKVTITATIYDKSYQCVVTIK